MTPNESSTDRLLRGVVAVVALIAALLLSGPIRIILFVVAAIMAVTAAVGFCPIYRVLGIGTRK
ncbi:YgaP family membrane protein [Corynebacterium nasicanis]|uniref:DUF2892 domain-containing protein n=1 Tax=Corynebacterium nasicanis TaxID=1448267 RepID=A0ABW1QF09_9CORY